MPTTTTRLALTQPATTDAANELRLAITANATTLDNAALITSGTLASRPAAGTIGKRYYATDTGQWYEDTGSAWTLAMTGDSSWTNVTLATGYIAGNNYAPSSRLVGGLVHLRGQIVNNTGATAASSATYATLAAAHRPAAGVQIPALAFVGGAASTIPVTIQTSGTITPLVAMSNGSSVSLDGLVISLS